MYYWKQCLSFSCPATSYSGVFTIVARIRECLPSRCLVTTTFLYCCAFEHAYRAIAWQRFGQILYNIYIRIQYIMWYDPWKQDCAARGDVRCKVNARWTRYRDNLQQCNYCWETVFSAGAAPRLYNEDLRRPLVREGGRHQQTRSCLTIKNLVESPRGGLYSKIDWPTDRRS
jgi:hypothetical protein